jgi:hypothetical protein
MQIKQLIKLRKIRVLILQKLLKQALSHLMERTKFRDDLKLKINENENKIYIKKQIVEHKVSSYNQFYDYLYFKNKENEQSLTIIEDELKKEILLLNEITKKLRQARNKVRVLEYQYDLLKKLNNKEIQRINEDQMDGLLVTHHPLD